MDNSSSTGGDIVKETDLAEHPALSKFNDAADHLSRLISSEVEFASICCDYVDISEEISGKKRENICDTAPLMNELLRLRSDLESDIFDRLQKENNECLIGSTGG